MSSQSPNAPSNTRRTLTRQFGITPLQASFARALAELGRTGLAGAAVGISEQQAAQLARHPSVKAAAAAHRQHVIDTELATLSITLYRQILTDTSAPIRERRMVAKDVLDRAGHAARADYAALSDKPLDAMTIDELSGMIALLGQQIEGSAIDVTPSAAQHSSAPLGAESNEVAHTAASDVAAVSGSATE